jgi:hypothetical protein
MKSWKARNDMPKPKLTLIKTPTREERIAVLREDLKQLAASEADIAKMVAEHPEAPALARMLQNTRKARKALEDFISLPSMKEAIAAADRAQRGVETAADRELFDRLDDLEEEYPDEDFPELED